MRGSESVPLEATGITKHLYSSDRISDLLGSEAEGLKRVQLFGLPLARRFKQLWQIHLISEGEREREGEGEGGRDGERERWRERDRERQRAYANIAPNGLDCWYVG